MDPVYLEAGLRTHTCLAAPAPGGGRRPLAAAACGRAGAAPAAWPAPLLTLPRRRQSCAHVHGGGAYDGIYKRTLIWRIGALSRIENLIKAY